MPIELAARVHHSLGHVDPLDLRVAQRTLRHQPAHGSEDLLRLHFARDHFRDQAVGRLVIFAADDRELHLAARDGARKAAGELQSDPAAAEAEDARGSLGGHGILCGGEFTWGRLAWARLRTVARADEIRRTRFPN